MRKIIREEVRVAVKEALKETRTTSKQVVEQKRPTTSTQQKYNTGNKFLDDVLSETVVTRDFGREESYGGGDFGFTTDDIQVSGLMSEEDVPSSPLPQSATLPFMKDYSAVLKKAEKLSESRSI